ncbi:MAG: hypothetical protein ACI90V_006983 [Bacillariaceae sp.]|jgi:hypothetical protein
MLRVFSQQKFYCQQGRTPTRGTPVIIDWNVINRKTVVVVVAVVVKKICRRVQYLLSRIGIGIDVDIDRSWK